MLPFTSYLEILLFLNAVLFKFIPSLNIWSVDISSGLLECRRCHLNCRTNESRMQFFRCALLWETLKLSCWRECSMKDDPSHFSHDIEPVQLQKRLISKFTGNFITCFVSIYPAKSAFFQPTFQF